MKVSTLFRIDALIILVQIALGGLLTFNFISPVVHIAMGSIVLIFVVSTAIVVFRPKPRPEKQLLQVSIGMLFAIAVQIVLGFATLALSSNILAWIHLMLGVLIYAMSLTGQFFAREWERGFNLANPASPARQQG
jgi:heme A synthase